MLGLTLVSATVASDALGFERIIVENAVSPAFGFAAKQEPLGPPSRMTTLPRAQVARRNSGDGERQTNLPVEISLIRAGARFEGELICVRLCGQDGLAFPALRDPSLRRGDAVMTPAGFVVFVGAAGGRHAVSDFSALDAAPLDVEKRGALQEMERASLPAARPTIAAWLAGQAANAVATSAPAPTSAAPEIVARAGTEAKIRLVVWRGATD